jgi:hypothetical protein
MLLFLTLSQVVTFVLLASGDVKSKLFDHGAVSKLESIASIHACGLKSRTGCFCGKMADSLCLGVFSHHNFRVLFAG